MKNKHIEHLKTNSYKTLHYKVSYKCKIKIPHPRKSIVYRGWSGEITLHKKTNFSNHLTLYLIIIKISTAHQKYNF